MATNRAIYLIAWIALQAFAACGEEPDRPIISGNTVATNNATTNNATTGTNSGTVVPDMCEVDEEFADESVQAERDLVPSEYVVSCSEDVEEKATDGGYVAQLIFAETTDINIGVLGLPDDEGGFPPRPLVELLEGSCDGGRSVLCGSMASATATLQANTPYYLVVNGLLTSGGIAITIDAETVGCSPGEFVCVGETVNVCTNTGGTREIQCPTECGGRTCLGNSCPSPAVIAPVLNGEPVVLQSNRLVFTDNWDADGKMGCETVPDEGSFPTPGPEMFVVVEGVEAGQTVSFEASNQRFGFFVVDGCDATSCLGAYEFDANSRNRGEYTAATSGDVTVVMEAFGSDNDREFTVEVSLRE